MDPSSEARGRTRWNEKTGREPRYFAMDGMEAWWRATSTPPPRVEPELVCGLDAQSTAANTTLR